MTISPFWVYFHTVFESWLRFNLNYNHFNFFSCPILLSSLPLYGLTLSGSLLILAYFNQRNITILLKFDTWYCCRLVVKLHSLVMELICSGYVLFTQRSLIRRQYFSAFSRLLWPATYLEDSISSVMQIIYHTWKNYGLYWMERGPVETKITMKWMS